MRFACDWPVSDLLASHFCTKAHFLIIALNEIHEFRKKMIVVLKKELRSISFHGEHAGSVLGGLLPMLSEQQNVLKTTTE